MNYYESMGTEQTHEQMLDELFGQELGDWQQARVAAKKTPYTWWQRKREIALTYPAEVIHMASATSVTDLVSSFEENNRWIVTSRTSEECLRVPAVGKFIITDTMNDIRARSFKSRRTSMYPERYKDVERSVRIHSFVKIEQIPDVHPSKGSWDRFLVVDEPPIKVVTDSYWSTPESSTPVSDLTLFINDRREVFAESVKTLLEYKRTQGV